jgi:hypothetical protein
MQYFPKMSLKCLKHGGDRTHCALEIERERERDGDKNNDDDDTIIPK